MDRQDILQQAMPLWTFIQTTTIPHSATSGELYDIGIALEEIDAFVARAFMEIRGGRNADPKTLVNCLNDLVDASEKLSPIKAEGAAGKEKDRLNEYIQKSKELVLLMQKIN